MRRRKNLHLKQPRVKVEARLPLGAATIAQSSLRRVTRLLSWTGRRQHVGLHMLRPRVWVTMIMTPLIRQEVLWKNGRARKISKLMRYKIKMTAENLITFLSKPTIKTRQTIKMTFRAIAATVMTKMMEGKEVQTQTT
jgi:hypothetical protein